MKQLNNTNNDCPSASYYRSSATPETDKIADDFTTSWNAKTSQFMMLARKLERQRDELIKVAKHCRLFIGDRRGYRNNEEMERDDICKRITALLYEEWNDDGGRMPDMPGEMNSLPNIKGEIPT